MVILLAGCGGGSATSVGYNSGEPPETSLPHENGRLEHQLKKHNDGVSVACSRAESATELDPRDCKVEPRNKSDAAEIEVLGPRFGDQHEVTECRSSPNQRCSQMPRGVCEEIH
jgi:hypothetical protein